MIRIATTIAITVIIIIIIAIIIIIELLYYPMKIGISTGTLKALAASNILNFNLMYFIIITLFY